LELLRLLAPSPCEPPCFQRILFRPAELFPRLSARFLLLNFKIFPGPEALEEGYPEGLLP